MWCARTLRTLKLKRVNGMRKPESLEQDGGHCIVLVWRAVGYSGFGGSQGCGV